MYLAIGQWHGLFLVLSSVCWASASPPSVPIAEAGALSPRGTSRNEDIPCWADVRPCPPRMYCAPRLRKEYGMCLPCVAEGKQCYPLLWFKQHTCCGLMVCDQNEHRCVPATREEPVATRTPTTQDDTATDKPTEGIPGPSTSRPSEVTQVARKPCKKKNGRFCPCHSQAECIFPGRRQPLCCDTEKGFCRPARHNYCLRLKAGRLRGWTEFQWQGFSAGRVGFASLTSIFLCPSWFPPDSQKKCKTSKQKKKWENPSKSKTPKKSVKHQNKRKKKTSKQKKNLEIPSKLKKLHHIHPSIIRVWVKPPTAPPPPHTHTHILCNLYFPFSLYLYISC